MSSLRMYLLPDLRQHLPSISLTVVALRLD
jgi:hypothetical protein